MNIFVEIKHVTIKGFFKIAMVPATYHYNMPGGRRAINKSEFTRGEKCIFVHLIITFAVILILVVIYATHLYFVSHRQHSIFITRRNIIDSKQAIGYPSVGYVYVNLTVEKFVCNTLLLQSRWSLCPAHCVDMRTNPNMGHLLQAWGLKYSFGTGNSDLIIIDTRIQKSIIHPLFNRDSFDNNVGLLEHADSIPHRVSMVNNGAVFKSLINKETLQLVGWNHSVTEFFDDLYIGQYTYNVYIISMKNCLESLTPIIVIRDYEFCITLPKRNIPVLDYGAVVLANSNPIGFLTWGERIKKSFPLVMINVTFFQDWIKTKVI